MYLFVRVSSISAVSFVCQGFPLIFHGVPGKDERESNSPSFFNTSEITVVVEYLKKLLLTQGKKGIAKISPKDIGIITPYRKQVGTSTLQAGAPRCIYIHLGLSVYKGTAPRTDVYKVKRKHIEITQDTFIGAQPCDICRANVAVSQCVHVNIRKIRGLFR